MRNQPFGGNRPAGILAGLPAVARATISLLPPGANGATRRIALLGPAAWARATSGRPPATTVAAAERLSAVRRVIGRRFLAGVSGSGLGEWVAEFSYA